MKKISKKCLVFLIVLGSLLTYQTSQSQIIISLLLGDKLNSGKMEFGIDGGYSRSNLSGIEEAKGLGSLNLGFYFDFTLKNNWYLNTGVRVKSTSGATKLNSYSLDDPELDTVFYYGHVTREIGYFYVPVHIKYRFAKQFFVNAGVQIGLRNKANDYFKNTYFEKDDVTFKFDIREYIKRIDAGLSGGVGYKFRGTGMNLGITYYYGLMNIMKDDAPQQYNYFSKNSAVYFYVNIPVGAGYKDENKKNNDG